MNSEVGAELLALANKWAQAFVENDPESIGQFMSDDWMVISPDGAVIDKPSFVEVIRSGALTHDEMDFDELRVRVYGDSAIVTGRATVKGTYNGEAFSGQERSTDFFVKSGVGWTCVFTQLTAIAAKQDDQELPDP
jgi:ketosteroid isomerase-like protein